MEFGGDKALRVDAAPRTVLVDHAHGHPADLIREAPQREVEAMVRILAQRTGRDEPRLP